MTISVGNPKAKRVTCDADTMWVELADGCTLDVPFAYFPRLLLATDQQRRRH